jgi:hypothetical protein
MRKLSHMRRGDISPAGDRTRFTSGLSTSPIDTESTIQSCHSRIDLDISWFFLDGNHWICAPPWERNTPVLALWTTITASCWVLTSSSMIIATFRRLQSYRIYYLAACILSSAIHNWRMKQIPLTLVGDALVPDSAMLTGYTPPQLLSWYDAIGPHGRKIYFQLFLIDICFIIPSYVLFLGTQLLSMNSATSLLPDVLCYLPIATAVFDLIESVTHGLAVVASWKPSTLHIIVASAATQFKFLTLALSLFFAVVIIVVTYVRPMDKIKAS